MTKNNLFQLSFLNQISKILTTNFYGFFRGNYRSLNEFFFLEELSLMDFSLSTDDTAENYYLIFRINYFYFFKLFYNCF